MNYPDSRIVFYILYALTWCSLFAGILLIRKDYPRAKRMRTWLLNKRIEQFKIPPFKNLLKLWMSGKYFLTSVFFLFLTIIPAVILFFLIGMSLIMPVLAVYQGLTVGFFIAYNNRRDTAWALAVGLFETGYWSLSGALGMSVTLGVILYKLSFAQSLLNVWDQFISVYWIPVAVCIVVNAFGEVAGPIYWDIASPLSLETLSKGEPVDENYPSGR